MAMYLDNPAGRLQAMFEAVRREKPNDIAAQSWANVFGVTLTDHWLLLRRAAEVVHLAVETRRLITKHEDEDAPTILANFDQIETSLSHFLVMRSVTLESFLSPLLAKSGEHCLEVCSMRLHRSCPEPSISESDRTSLLADLDDLIDDVVATNDLDPEIKSWVLQRLNEIRDALATPELFGTESVATATDALIGGILRVPARAVALGESTVRAKMWSAISRLEVVLSAAASALVLTAGQSEPQGPGVVLHIEQRIEQHVDVHRGSRVVFGPRLLTTVDPATADSKPLQQVQRPQLESGDSN